VRGARRPAVDGVPALPPSEPVLTEGRPQGLADLDDLDALFTALAHPVRRHVLQVLHARGGELTVGDLARRFSHSWPTTTRHLKVLTDAGVVSVAAVGRERHVWIDHKRLRVLLDLWCTGVGLTVSERGTDRGKET
jgi:DNA-binding transcriptional ArsR family regulator